MTNDHAFCARPFAGAGITQVAPDEAAQASTASRRVIGSACLAQPCRRGGSAIPKATAQSIRTTPSREAPIRKCRSSPSSAKGRN